MKFYARRIRKSDKEMAALKYHENLHAMHDTMDSKRRKVMKKETAFAAARYGVFKTMQLTSAGLGFVAEKTAFVLIKADTYFAAKCAFAKRDYQKESANDKSED